MRSRDFSAFGTVILVREPPRGPSFLARPRNEAKEGRPGVCAPLRVVPSLRIIESALCQLASLKHDTTKAPPRLFLARLVSGGEKNTSATIADFNRNLWTRMLVNRM
jgi:hypothetical protein